MRTRYPSASNRYASTLLAMGIALGTSTPALGQSDVAGLKKIIALQQARLEALAAKVAELSSDSNWGPNILPHSDFASTESNGTPKNWTPYFTEGSAVITSAPMHPFTSGFIGAYTPTPSAGSLDPTMADTASESSPVWYQRYNTGPRISRAGWGTAPFNLLKLSISGNAAVAGIFAHDRSYFSGPSAKLKVRAYVKFLKGNSFGASQDVNADGVVVTRAECDKQPQRWCLLEGTFSPQNTSGGYIGFGRPRGQTEAVEVLLALPYMTVVNPVWRN